MIAFLRGRLAGKTAAAAVVDVNGVGYEVGMSQAALAKLPAVGGSVELHTYLHVREDAMLLYGFLSLEEKSLFERLIGVSGVGPKVALAALSFYAPQELSAAIAAQDVARVAKVPGIGKKTAQRIILDLKGSLAQEGETLFGGEESPADAGRSDTIAAVGKALLSMGLTSAEADVALKGAPADADESALLRYALGRLGAA